MNLEKIARGFFVGVLVTILVFAVLTLLTILVLLCIAFWHGLLTEGFPL